MADRLRVESEQALGSLQVNDRAVREQLAQALHRAQEKDRELESLRAEHGDICRKLRETSLQQQLERAELDALRNALRIRDKTDRDQQTQIPESEEAEDMQHDIEPKLKAAETEDDNIGKQKNWENSNEMDARDPKEPNGTESMQLTGRGVAEGYLRSLATLEKKKERQRDPRRTVMLSERSWLVCVNIHHKNNRM